MDRGIEQLINDFTVKAQKLFTSSFENFRNSTKKLDRQEDENVFQLQLGKYLKTLKLQLENIASELVTKNKSIKNSGQLVKLLGNQILIYLGEFRQKARSL